MTVKPGLHRTQTHSSPETNSLRVSHLTGWGMEIGECRSWCLLDPVNAQIQTKRKKNLCDNWRTDPDGDHPYQTPFGCHIPRGAGLHDSTETCQRKQSSRPHIILSEEDVVVHQPVFGSQNKHSHLRQRKQQGSVFWDLIQHEDGRHKPLFHRARWKNRTSRF